MGSVMLTESLTEHSEKENEAPQNRQKHNSVWFLTVQVHVTLLTAHLKRSQAKQSTSKFLVLPEGPHTWKWPPHVHTILAQDRRRSDRNSRLHPTQHILKLLSLQCRQGFL